jgi:cation transport ATPase
MWYWLLCLSSLVFIAVLTTYFYRRRVIKELPPEQKRPIRLALVSSLWFFLTIVIIGVVIASSASDLGGAVPMSLKVALVMPIIFVLLTILLIIAGVRVWRSDYWRTMRRVQYTIIVLSAVAISLFFATWNLLGWRFG